MIEHFTEIWHGYCPEFDEDEHQIKVSLMKAHTLGGVTSRPIIENVRCLNERTCHYLAIHNQCPLLEKFSR